MPTNNANIGITYIDANTPPLTPSDNEVYFCKQSESIWVGDKQHSIGPLEHDITTYSFDDGIDSYFKKVVSTIVPVQAGSGTPSPTNVRVIGGFTECTVEDADNETAPTQTNTAIISFGSDVGSDTVEFNQLISGLISSTTKDGLTITNNGDGSVSISGTAEATGTVDLSNILTVPRNNSVIFFNCVFSNALSDGNYLYFGGYGTSYLMTERGRFFKRNDGTNWSSYIVLHYESGTIINTRIWINTHNLTQMFGASTADYIYNLEQSTSGAGVAWFRTLYPRNYYPYNTGELMSVVYGGYVDLISGKLVVDSAYLTPTSVRNVEYNAGKNLYYWTIGLVPLPINSIIGLYSSHFKAEQSVNAGNCYIAYNVLFLIPTDQTLNTKALADAWMVANNPQFVYKLATPQEYQLTPAQLRSLVGANRLTSSTGEVTEVEYIRNETISWVIDQIQDNSVEWTVIP